MGVTNTILGNVPNGLRKHRIRGWSCSGTALQLSLKLAVLRLSGGRTLVISLGAFDLDRVRLCRLFAGLGVDFAFHFSQTDAALAPANGVHVPFLAYSFRVCFFSEQPLSFRKDPS